MGKWVVPARPCPRPRPRVGGGRCSDDSAAEELTQRPPHALCGARVMQRTETAALMRPRRTAFPGGG